MAGEANLRAKALAEIAAMMGSMHYLLQQQLKSMRPWFILTEILRDEDKNCRYSHQL